MNFAPSISRGQVLQVPRLLALQVVHKPGAGRHSLRGLRVVVLCARALLALQVQGVLRLPGVYAARCDGHELRGLAAVVQRQGALRLLQVQGQPAVPIYLHAAQQGR